jgi:predicted GH43/DUF377 family glycosyl hydrolase
MINAISEEAIMARDIMKTIGISFTLILLLIQLADAQYQWQRFPAPVLPTESLRGWDSYYCTQPSVMYRNGVYQMWYMGWTSYSMGAGQSIGYAISIDGEKWFRYSRNPILDRSIATWTDGTVRVPAVSRIDTEYVMLFGTGPAGTSHSHPYFGLATSPDAVTWTTHPSPVLTMGSPGEWDSYRLMQVSSILEWATRYWIWYSAMGPQGYCIGAATSDDMISWQKEESNPVLSPGQPGEWDAFYVGFPDVFYRNEKLEMWYSGQQIEGHQGSIGMAFSSDGVHWTKNASNPVLDPGPGNSWDNFVVQAPAVVYVDDTVKVWYAAQGTSSPWISEWNIGLAISPVTTEVPRIPQSRTLPAAPYLSIQGPNPFNNEIEFEIYSPSKMVREIRIYNVLGQVVRTFNVDLPPGVRSVIRWDGKDDRGQDVTSGAYWVQMEGNGAVYAKKMLKLK